MSPDQTDHEAADSAAGADSSPEPAGVGTGEDFAAGGAGGPGAAPGDPSEEELRAAYEEELSRITVTDMIAQAAVSLLNIAARRLGPPPSAQTADSAAADAGGRDLDQVRDAIDGVRALLAILERTIPQEVRPLRDALSQLQMAYAAEVKATAGAGAVPETAAGAGAGDADASPKEGAPGEDPPQPAAPDSGPGPAQASGRLWVPGS